MPWRFIETVVEKHLGAPFKIESKRSVGGGCIHDAWIIAGADHRYFVKTNNANCFEMFCAEREGLHELAKAGAIRVPVPIACEIHGAQSFLIMECLTLGVGQRHSAARLGEQLAALHRTVFPTFGWQHNNFIGATPQVNVANTSWVDFWCKSRLGYQLDLACNNGQSSVLRDVGDRLLARVPVFFADYNPQPSLLHGDLWSGNVGYDEHGEPVIFDPAVYYGDREADLAMTELFGGFPSQFYQAYQATYPLDAGYVARKELYNLYHVLNHANLFGGGYGQQAVKMMGRLLAH